MARLSDQDLLGVAKQALSRLESVFPEAPEKADRHKVDAYVPHAINYLRIDKLAHQSPSLLKSALVRKLAEHLFYQGRAGQAMGLHLDALELATKLCDSLSPVLLRAKYEAAVMAKYFRQFDQAKKFCQEIIDPLEEAKIINRTLINSMLLVATILAENRSWKKA
jgi:tetratricopeptide (TPR) repeat protein